MGEKIEVEVVDKEDYRLYNLAMERMAQAIPVLRLAIANLKDLENHGFDMDVFILQDAMVEIATVFAGIVAGLKYIKPSKEETK